MLTALVVLSLALNLWVYICVVNTRVKLDREAELWKLCVMNIRRDAEKAQEQTNIKLYAYDPYCGKLEQIVRGRLESTKTAAQTLVDSDARLVVMFEEMQKKMKKEE